MIEKNRIKRSNIFYAFEENCLVTVLESRVPLYDAIFAKTAAKPVGEKMTPAGLMVEILDEDVNENYEVLELSENQITELQKKVAVLVGIEETISGVVELRRTLNRMSRAFWGTSRIAYALHRGFIGFELTDEEKRLVDDVHDALIHQIDIISSQKEMLTDAITIYQTSVSNRLASISNRINVGIRRLTWIMLLLTGAAMVLTIPNTVATVFGIPAWSIAASDWSFIAGILLISTIIPILWFAYYWHKIRREAAEEKS
jgi:Mg2+ and Co2+ transporter CorA